MSLMECVSGFPPTRESSLELGFGCVKQTTEHVKPMGSGVGRRALTGHFAFRHSAQLMHPMLFIAWLSAALLWAPAATAQSGQCGFIKDPDLQAQCRAGSGGGSANCGFIRDADQQAYCRALTGSGSGSCGFIRNGDLQSMCRAMTGSGPASCGFIRDADLQALCRARF